MSKPTLICAYI